MGEELICHSLHNQKWLGVKKYTYGATQMDEKAFRMFMQKNNREAYLKYMQGEQLIYAGWGTIGGGMALSITGGMIMWLGGRRYIYDIGVPMVAVGGGISVAAGIPLLSVGYTRQRNAIFKKSQTKN